MTELKPCPFSNLANGDYFTMKKGLLFRKVGTSDAVDVWSGRKIIIDSEYKVRVVK